MKQQKNTFIVKNMKKTLLLLLMSIFVLPGSAQSILNTLDFFYAGQSKSRKMFVVKKGEVRWHYDDPNGKGEISDAILLTDGHILMAQQYSIRELDSKGNVVWEMDVPKGNEVHTIQPIGKHLILYVQNGKPAKVVVRSIPDLQLVKEFVVPTGEGGSVHGQFRNARLTRRGTLLISHMSQGYVAEYNSEGEELNRWTAPSPWSATELDNEHILIVARKGLLREIERTGKMVWETNLADHEASQAQKAYILKNGHILVSNWFNEWDKKPIDTANPPIQAIEINREGTVLGELRSWTSPNLGPATTIQPLYQKVNRKKMAFGKLR